MTCLNITAAAAGERRRTGVNETETETGGPRHRRLYREFAGAMHAVRRGSYKLGSGPIQRSLPAQPVRVVAKDVLDRGSDSGDGVAGARPRGGQQDQAGVRPALRQPLSRKRAEVLDVVRDHGPAFAQAFGRLPTSWEQR